MEESPPLFALFVGINNYHPASGVSPLQGAVNDARAVARTVSERFGAPLDNVVTLLDEAATCAAILQALDSHFVARAQAWKAAGGEAGQRPHFLFFFAGCGALALEDVAGMPRMVESLVAYDSRLPGARDLHPADLAGPLAAVKAADCTATLVFGCSHLPDGAQVRACAPDLRPANATDACDRWDRLGAHLVTAARWGEYARERAVSTSEGVVVRGNFSLVLERMLHALRPGEVYTWSDFTARLIDRASVLAPDQTPRCAGADGPLLGGAVVLQAPGPVVTVDDQGQLWLSAGTSHGVLPGCRLVLYPAWPVPNGREGEAPSVAAPELAVVEVTHAGVDRSACELVEGLVPHTPAQAAIVQPGTARARIQWPDTAAHPWEGGAAGPLQARLRAVADFVDEAADFNVVQADGVFWICSSAGTRLAGPFVDAESDALRIELAHRARYNVALAQRGGVAELPPASIALAVERLVFDAGGFPHGAPLEWRAGEPTLTGGMPVVLHVTNRSDRALEIALFRFGSASEIACLWPTQGAHTEALPPGATRSFGCSARPQDQIHTPLPSGAVETRIMFRVYASAAPMAAALLEQGPLGARDEIAQAGMSSAPQPPPAPWVSDERGLRLVAPVGAAPIVGVSGAASMQAGALPRIEAPPQFAGAFQWVGAAEHARLAGAAWPAGLAAHPEHFRPYAASPLTPGEGFAGLEIRCDERSRHLVCADDPLRLFLAPPLGAALMAFAFDGSDAYPVGRCPVGGASLDVTWLPPTPSARTEGASAAQIERTIRIYICEVRGAPAADVGLFAVRLVPRGWAATASRAHFGRTVPGGELRYTRATRARPNERIALVIHGFADDSAEEAYWLTQLQRRPNAPTYDRILCFEWESLHTDVRASAQRLRDAVDALALDDARGVEIDLFAHSMGALVARAYVELLGGDAHVRRCFFTGPPNLGTPLATTALFTPWLLTLLLNLPAPTAPALLIAWALGGIAWDAQGPAAMMPGAALLKELNGTRGTARLRYHVLAGSTQGTLAEAGARWRRVLAEGLHVAADWFYDGENDWVVGVRSCLAVPVVNHPGGMLLSAVVDAVHTGYYRSEGATAQILRWLAPALPPDAPDAPASFEDAQTSVAAGEAEAASSTVTPMRRTIRFRKPPSR